MSKKIYVGRLPYSVNDGELRALFEQYGDVETASVVLDRDNQNRSKGFGFVEMPDDKQADDAIEALNNYQMGRMQLVVNEARPREERGGFAPRGGQGFGGGNRGGYAPREQAPSNQPNDNTQLYVADDADADQQ
jgi:RNA recognition motif-containing protein